MKLKKHRLANDEVNGLTRMKHTGSFERCPRVFAKFSQRRHLGTKEFSLSLAALLGIGLFLFVPLSLAHGSSGGHGSMSGGGNGGHNQHYRSFDPFWSPPFLYHTGIYSSAYCYTPTPEQQATAKKQVEAYLSGVRKNRKPAATHRYISVETLRPTREQLDDYSRRQQSVRSAKSAQLHCLMVFDTQTREFVGSGCYIVDTQPSTGEVARFESVSAEFVGRATL
jgi:hypothetical protein